MAVGSTTSPSSDRPAPVEPQQGGILGMLSLAARQDLRLLLYRLPCGLQPIVGHVSRRPDGKRRRTARRSAR